MSFENFLLIDASSPLSVIAGKLGADGRSWAGFVEEKFAALDGIFSALEKLSDTPPARGFLFCEGPGSVLGIRIAAAAVRAKLALDRAAGNSPTLPVFAFRSLRLAAQLATRAFPAAKNFVVAAESRINVCNVLRVENGIPADDFEEIKSADAEKFSGEKIFTLPARRALPPAFANAERLDVAALLKNDPAIFSDVPELVRDCRGAPDAVNTASADSYVRWSPDRRRDGAPADAAHFSR